MAAIRYASKSEFAASVIVGVSFMLVSATVVQARSGHIFVLNGFRSETGITCSSNTRAIPTYTATMSEIYLLAFETEAEQYWDCYVENYAYSKSGTFRFWGDAIHGGQGLWNCVDCKFFVDSFGVSMHHQGKWRYHYHCPSHPPSHQQALAYVASLIESAKFDHTHWLNN